jgi:AcrR family transcriptional regulator
MLDMAPGRRGEIEQAALRCFLDRGYAATTIADIRKASGASTGSIYHFFSGKPELARVLLNQAVAGWSAAADQATGPLRTPERVIKGSVLGLLNWGLLNPHELRFVDEIRTLGHAQADFVPLAAMLVDGQRRAAEVYAGFAATGAVRPLPWPLANALISGPTYTFLRLGDAANAEAARLSLPDAAWRAVRA